MFLFLIPLVIGFIFNSASALTTAFSRRWGDRRGSLITMILRNVLGIPVWAIGFVLAARTQSKLIFAKMIVTDVVGLLMVIAGSLIILLALVAIRSIAVAPSIRDHLVQNGLYAHVRHPTHSGAFLEFAGLFLLRPTQSIAVACVLGVIWVLVLTRLEEFDLLQRVPNYRKYMDQVPRFMPRLR